MKKPLQVELNIFNKVFLKLDVAISKAAFSKARAKISPNAFRRLFELTSKLWLNSDEFSAYKNHRIFAIDGSCIQLESTKELMDEFGVLGSNETACRARASILCDVLDGVIVHCSLESIHTDERSIALKHIEYFDEFAKENDIIIFDRGYPSKDFIAEFAHKTWKYLIRIPKGFNDQIDRSMKTDFRILIKHKRKGYIIRVLKFQLPSGETEMLITNISDKAFKHEDFKELYFKRWPVEIKYDTVKNKLLLESFSGRTSISIKQDFYATMYLANIVAFSKDECDHIIAEDQKDKSLKYEYQVNEKTLIGSLKNDLVLALICKKPEVRVEILNRVLKEASRSRSEIRPGRQFERPTSKKRGSTEKVKRKNSI